MQNEAHDSRVISLLEVVLELRALTKKGSVQQPWKDHVPTVSEIDGLVIAGLAEDVIFELVVLLEVVELVVLVVLGDVVVDVVEVEDVVDVARVVPINVEVDERPGAPTT